MAQRHGSSIHVGLGGVESQVFQHNDGLEGELTLQGPLYSFRASRDDHQIGLRGLIGRGPPLFPIAQCAQGDMIAGGKFLLGQT